MTVETVQLAKAVRRDGAPEVIKAVEAGNLSIHAAQEIISNYPISEQPAAVNEKIAAPKDKRGRVIGKPKAPKRWPTKPLPFRMDRCLDQLENAVELLAQFITEDGADPHADHSSWLKRISKARTALSRIINNQGGHDE